MMNYSLHTAITTLAGNGLLVGLHGLVVVVGIIIGMIQARKEDAESYFPFGPSIAIATVFCMFWGDGIIGWYLSLF